jgi:hypothetical protein
MRAISKWGIFWVRMWEEMTKSVDGLGNSALGFWKMECGSASVAQCNSYKQRFVFISLINYPKGFYEPVVVFLTLFDYA